MKHLLWIASYPKSGNTWVRVFLANLQKGGSKAIDINEIGDYRANSRELFDRFSGLKCSLLMDEETLRCRPQLYRLLNDALDNQAFLKTHSPYLCTSNKESLFPPEISRGAIYVLRNPLDIAGSFAHHNQQTIDQTIRHMANVEYSLSTNQNGHPSKGLLYEPISSWSQNVVSWVDQTAIPSLVVRYEDLLSHPADMFKRLAEFAGLPTDPQQIQIAIELSRFDALSQQEKINGFQEKPLVAESFFRKGKMGSWRDELTAAQVQRIIQDHGEVMRRFGYLDDNNLPVF